MSTGHWCVFHPELADQRESEEMDSMVEGESASFYFLTGDRKMPSFCED